MIDFKGLRDALFSGLNEELDALVIEANQGEFKPDYPFITILFMEPLQSLQPHTGDYRAYETEEEFEMQREASQEMYISVTSFSDDSADSIQNAYDAAKWFAFKGSQHLKENGIVIVSIGSITNRDTLIEGDYEKRNGFDVRLRFVSDIKKKTDVIEKVELDLMGENKEIES